MHRDELQKILIELDQALYNHQQWHKELIRTFACRSACDKHDISSKAHKECRFGQWYYSGALKTVNDHHAFIAIGEAHKHMHELATKLLLNVNSEKTITPFEYDTFSNALDRLRLEIFSLKNELETLLYNHDPLTMTINRVAMLPMLREQQELSKRQLQTCCVAMINIDRFKKVNDKYGHIVGDKVLILLADYLMKNTRSYDKVFRFGGEEFLLCMPHTNLQQAFDLVDRIRDGIAIMPFHIGLPDPIHIAISCGIAMLSPDTTIEKSIDATDQALYVAKSSGRNRTHIFTDDKNLTA